MQLVNSTAMNAACTMGLDLDGRELLVVVVKGTFVLPRAGESVRLHRSQQPLVLADTFTGEPGRSAPRHEIDFAPRKRACDVLLLGSAHAPRGRPVTRMPVGLRVGALSKTCEVVGHRVWRAGLAGIRASDPEPFTTLPVSYDTAFGGTRDESDDASEHCAYAQNPVGLGFHTSTRSALVDGLPLPNTEEFGRPASRPSERLRPMAFGPVGRGWPQRACHGGTYDQQWIDEVAPFLPANFDERFYQAAPADQQMPLNDARLEVALTGFTPDGERRFVLPAFDAPVHVFPRGGGHETHRAALDTIVFEPDDERFTLTWRVTRPLRRNLLEIAEVLIGRKSPAWLLARRLGKRHLDLRAPHRGQTESAP